MSDILEIELQLLKDNSTKSIKTTLKNGEEIVLYSPYYVKLLETENKQLQQENKQLKEQKNKLRDYIVDQLKEYEKGIEDYKRYGIEDYTNGMAVGFKKCLEVLGADNENSRN